MSEKVKLEVLSPRGVVEAKTANAPAPHLTDLAGKRVGLYHNGKPGLDNFFTVFEELLKKKYPTAMTNLIRGSFEITNQDAEDWAPKIDTFVYGVGD